MVKGNFILRMVINTMESGKIIPSMVTVFTHLGKANGRVINTKVTIIIWRINFSGGWAQDQKSGLGVYSWRNGDTYSGQFLKDNFHGEGTLFKSSGSKYVGMWKDDKKSGPF